MCCRPSGQLPLYVLLWPTIYSSPGPQSRNRAYTSCIHKVVRARVSRTCPLGDDCCLPARHQPPNTHAMSRPSRVCSLHQNRAPYTSPSKARVCAARAGHQHIVFLEKGPLYLVGVSRRGEPAPAIHLLLDLLHAQLLCVLTQGFHSMFARNPRYDSRRLLGRLPLCKHTGDHWSSVASHTSAAHKPGPGWGWLLSGWLGPWPYLCQDWDGLARCCNPHQQDPAWGPQPPAGPGQAVLLRR